MCVLNECFLLLHPSLGVKGAVACGLLSASKRTGAHTLEFASVIEHERYTERLLREIVRVGSVGLFVEPTYNHGATFRG